MSLRDSVRALGGQIGNQQAASTDLAFAQGSVQSVSSGGVLTVLVLGNTIQAAYYGTQPVVGAAVDVLFIEGSPRILGVPHGVPTTVPTP